MIRMDVSHDSERCCCGFNQNDSVSSVYRDFVANKCHQIWFHFFLKVFDPFRCKILTRGACYES